MPANPWWTMFVELLTADKIVSPFTRRSIVGFSGLKNAIFISYKPDSTVNNIDLSSS